MWRFFLLLSLAMPAMAAMPTCESTDNAKVLLELFTSEGCSSCPPADHWLADIAGQFNPEQVITMAWHVDYWDYIGWKDKLADPQYGARQRGRVRAENSNNVYTPQLMINGRTQSWYRKPETLIQQQLLLNNRPTIQLSAQEQKQGNWLLTIKSTTHVKDTVLRAALLGDVFESKIDAGENAGRTLRHASPVLAYHAHADNSVILNPQGRKAVRAVAWLEKLNQSEVLAISSINLPGCTTAQ